MNQLPPRTLPIAHRTPADNPYNTQRFDPVAASPGLGDAELRQAVAQRAQALGFVAVGFLGVERFAQAGHALERWLDQGHHGTMRYMAELGGRDDPRNLFPDARGMVVLAMPYPKPKFAAPLRVASYAVGLDYHIVLRGRMQRLSQGLADCAGRSITVRSIVDSAPLLEREAARLAGLGFIGKSTMLIVPGYGPRILLGVLLVDLPFTSSARPLANRCGSCTRCLEACPNRAFPHPFVLDARRCVSYLTIEHKDTIPDELGRGCAGWVFGCDACIDACPFDHHPTTPEMLPEFTPRAGLGHVIPEFWLGLTSADYRKLARRTALRRTDRIQLVRNAILACRAHPTTTVRARLSDLAATHPLPWIRQLARSVVAELPSPQDSEQTP